jgi:ribosomal protein S24E
MSFALDQIDPKAKEASKSLLRRTEADVALHEGDIARKIKNGIARKVVRLELVEIQELPKEIGSRKAEAALKVSKENDGLTGFEYRFDLVARKPAGNFCRYPPGTVQPIDLVLRHVGAFPGSAGDTG